MAGGKETPRQKMIGMMYLVLTALLALNVSRSILDAFVAIEENIQEANLTELFRGDERRDEMVEAMSDETYPLKAKKAKLLKDAIDDIDEMTARRIRLIDSLKFQILDACGEDIVSVGKEGSILLEKYDPKKNALKPVRMNLEFVNGKDKYDEPMFIMIGEDIKRPRGAGLELWNSLNTFRKEITEKVASSQLGGGDHPVFSKEYFFKAPAINTFKSQEDLKTQIQKAIDASNVHPEDKAMILEIYQSLAKEEYSTVHDVEGVHWIGKTFDHSPSVAAIASLSSLQKDILAARANALAVIRSRIGGNDFSFNKVTPIVLGSEVVNQGEEFTLEVMMGAYDSDRQPEVTMNGEEVTDIHDGKGFIRLQAGQSGEMQLKGTVSVKTKAGIKKTLEWTKDVVVMKPSGSIELPQMNVLYRNYDNRITATASGFPETVLTASGASLTRSGGEYIARPTGTGRTAHLTVSGKTADGRTVQLKRAQYRVMNLPKPSLYFGAVAEGGTISDHECRLFAKYGPEIPLDAQFRIKSWEMSVTGGVGSKRGTGNNICNTASGMLRAAPRGSTVNFICRVVYPGEIEGILTGVFKK